jgi:hypothetical protein
MGRPKVGDTPDRWASASVWEREGRSGLADEMGQKRFRGPLRKKKRKRSWAAGRRKKVGWAEWGWVLGFGFVFFF